MTVRAQWNPGFKKGLTIGSARDGKVTAFVPFTEPGADKIANAGMEGITADSKGNVFVGETTTQTLKKFVKQ